jgi:hypothetical protein
MPKNYQLCWQCHKSLRDSSTSPIEGVTGKQYLQVYDSWFVKTKDWDINKIERIRAIKEKILFDDGFYKIIMT